MKRKTLFVTLSLVTLAVVLTLVVSLFGEKQGVLYAIADLGPCRHVSDLFDINDSGQILVATRMPDETWSTHLIEPDGTRISLEKENMLVYGNGINNKGQVVGFSRMKGTNETTAFLWDSARGFSFIEELDFGLCINDREEVAGLYLDENQNQIPCVWKKGSGIADLAEYFQGINPSLEGINNRGVVVGSCYTKDKGHKALIWDATHGVREIPPLGSHGITPDSLNDLNQVLCSSGDVGRLENALLGIRDWVKSGFKEGLDLRKYRQGRHKRFFIWENGQLRFIDDAFRPSDGWKLAWARGINNKGEIVGTGELHGEPHAFLLTPIDQVEKSKP